MRGSGGGVREGLTGWLHGRLGDMEGGNVGVTDNMYVGLCELILT